MELNCWKMDQQSTMILNTLNMKKPGNIFGGPSRLTSATCLWYRKEKKGREEMGETVDNEKHNNKTRTRSSEKEALGIRARNVWLFPAALLRSPINRMYLPTHAQTADRIQRRVCVDVYTPTCPEAHNGSRLLVQQPRIYPLLSTVCTRPSASTYTSTWSRNIYIYVYIQVYQDIEDSIRYTFPQPVFTRY